MAILTYRKLIRFGEGGLVITVPKGQVRCYGLKAGGRLEGITNRELTIRLEKEAHQLQQWGA